MKKRLLLFLCIFTLLLSTAAQALWDVVREQSQRLTDERQQDPLYQT